mgnify:FL=1
MKYIGSKARICKDILPLILRDKEKHEVYIEPFAGGMNTICEVSGIKRIASDINPYLISMWENVVYKDFKLPPDLSRDFYMEIKKDKSLHPPWVAGWAGFNCSYNGGFFRGYAGLTKTKEGFRDYQKEAVNNVLSQKEKLKGVEFLNKNYLDLNIPKNSLVYCDPPYKDVTHYGEKFDSDKFWSWVKDISIHSKVFISEYTAPSEFECIWEQELTSSLSRKNKTSVERLFTLKK